MFNRSKLLSLFLLLAVIFVSERIYDVWNGQPPVLPTKESKQLVIKTVSQQDSNETMARPPVQIATKNVIDKNLFDPERGMGKQIADKEAVALALATRRVRSMVLQGTAILPNGRYAILADLGDSSGPNPRLPGQTPQQGQLRRVKPGDLVEGFTVSEIEDRKIVLAKGPARVELVVDYFRKTEDGNVGRSSPPITRQRTGSSDHRQSDDKPAPAAPLAPRFPRRDGA